MTYAITTRFRGISGIRADSTDPATLIGEVNKAFEAFKAEHSKEVADIKAGMADVVQAEKVDRINAEITDLGKQLDEANKAISALKVGGAGGDAKDPAISEHAKAFSAWFRKGERAIDADIRDLEVKAALSTDKDDDGGYLVPEEMSNTIDRVVGTVSVMRDLATVMQIGTDTYKKLVSMGGAGSGWVGEREGRPETDTPTLRELAFNAQELYANPAITQRALDDSRLDIAAWLANEVSIEFAEQEGAAFISGNGVNKPRGILAYDTVANGSYTWGKIGFTASGVAAALTDGSNNGSDAMIDLYYSLKQQYRNGASWLMTDATMAVARKFKDGDGTYLWSPATAGAEVPTFLGKPVRTDDNMDAVAANAFPIAFGNFSRAYLIVDRFGTRVLRDPFTNKPYVHFYTTKRVGGGVQNFEAIKLLKVST
ncbi:phage major capsid protein [Sagittula sp. MA-2]|jgi:HK97 family phage major capsid protein|uniref:phage major capsid protein n=1 Tax=Sagittula sp. MA-2 TaxID=3048007 RepID=UPI0024C221B7|nr:phage major capsid protein [Sagittula sp. MA-2]WHZ35750.1 phage major capsid protein [Sagittula sp. MA-2]